MTPEDEKEFLEKFDIGEPYDNPNIDLYAIIEWIKTHTARKTEEAYRDGKIVQQGKSTIAGLDSSVFGKKQALWLNISRALNEIEAQYIKK